MSDRQALIAENVRAHLEAQSYDYGTIPASRFERKYFPIVDTSELDEVLISVACGEIDDVLQTRSNATQETYAIFIFIQKQYELDPEDIDPLRRLVEQIRRYLRGTKFQDARWILSINEGPVEPSEMQTSQVFRSIVRVLYRIVD